jgi:hypothetical protein
MKFSWEGYWKPTPKGIRKIADSILASAMCMATYSFFGDYKQFALIVMIVAGASKFVSNFFTDD